MRKNNKFLAMVWFTLSCLSGSLATCAEGNLLKSADFAADEYGELGVWTLSQAYMDVTRLPGQGVDGRDAVSLDFTAGSRLLHGGLKLVGGASYEFGGYVRSEDFSSSEYAGFMVHDPGWNKETMFRTGRFFRQTAGKWMKISQTFTAPKDGTYVFNIYAPGGKGRLEVSAPYVIPLDEKGKAGSEFVPPPVPASGKKRTLGKNMIVNGEFLPDFYGEYGIWSVYQRQVGITRLPGAGVEGCGAVRLDMTRSGSLIHPGLKVVKGSQYVFGAYVRSSGFSGSEYHGIMFHDSGWEKIKRTGQIPADTHGKWVRLSGVATAYKDGFFQLNIYCPGAKGTLELCKPFVIPLDGDGIQAAEVSIPLLENWKRLYPVSVELAALSPNEELPVVAHYRLADVAENYLLSAELAGRKEIVPLSMSQRVTVRFRGLPLGKSELKLQLIRKADSSVLQENRYSCVVKEPVAPVAEKELNNLVSEIRRWEKPQAGECHFTVAEQGWYSIAFAQPEKDFQLYLDSADEPILVPCARETPDTMRYLQPGGHTLRIAGNVSPGNALVVRKIKELVLFPLQENSLAPADQFRFTYDREFWRTHLWHAFNTQLIADHDTNQFLQAGNSERTGLWGEASARGMKVFSSGDVGGRPLFANPDVVEQSIRTKSGFPLTDGRAVDEIGTGGPFKWELQFGTQEAFWRLADLDKGIYLWMAQVRGYLQCPIVHSPLLAAVGNAASGNARMLMETYMLSEPDQNAYERSLEALSQHVQWADLCVPNGRRRMGFIISGYAFAGKFDTWIHPETDYKCIIESFCRKLAVDPRLKGIAALGFYNFPRCDEELTRWMVAVFRHYAIEGRTENLAEKYGFHFNPGHIRNGDFDAAEEGWTVQSAKEGSLVHWYEKDFGRKYEGRQRERGQHGDHAMLFIRSGEGPNRLSQQATGLVPGRKYALLFVTADPDEVKKPSGKMLEHFLGVSISDARLVEKGSYTLVQPGPVGKRAIRGKDGALVLGRENVAKPQFCTRKVVFIPEKAECAIVFSDWQDDKAPGAAVGQKRILHFVSLNPYFDEE